MGQYRNRIGYAAAFIERPKLLPIMTPAFGAWIESRHQRM
ncbi:hypothetical protein ANO14919_054470 [Xylariales sp. No.14919]|nr:hypothetical protein ANO14919_054470 [Xylariales sp. No.14919]